MQLNFAPRNISANKVERVVPNALKDFRYGESVLRASRSTFDCIRLRPLRATAPTNLLLLVGRQSRCYFFTGVNRKSRTSCESTRAV